MTELKKISSETLEKPGVTGICAGANLRTPCGPRRVEFLREGDLVVTRDNGLQAVKLIWTRTVKKSKIAADPSLAPVTVQPRAIAPMTPQKPVSVGAGHRLLVPGWRLGDEDSSENSLVAARDVDELCDGEPQRATGDVTYYNVVFEVPQVFLVNGLPVESFAPSEDNLDDLPRGVKTKLRKAFPDVGRTFKNYPAPTYRLRERLSYSPDFA